MQHTTQTPNSISLIRSIITIAICLLAISGCGSNEAEPEEPISIRAPRPTFTPTITANSAAANSAAANSAAANSAAANNATANNATANNAATNSPSAANQNATEPQEQVLENADAPSNSTPSGTGGAEAENSSPAAISSEEVQVEGGGVAVVSIQLLNGRAGPNAGSDLVGIVGQGEFFDIIGRNDAGDWWQVCCYIDTPFWVADEFVDIQGGNAPQAAAPPTTAPQVAVQPTSPPAAAQLAVEPPPASEEAEEDNFNFVLKASEQFPETNVPRIFLYVFQNDQALAGYSLKVTKDGAALSVNETSFGPQAGFTWPVESARQRFQNLKAEFPGQSPAGTWIVQLVDGSGNPAGPEATFNLSADDENQELYVRYEQQ